MSPWLFLLDWNCMIENGMENGWWDTGAKYPCRSTAESTASQADCMPHSVPQMAQLSNLAFINVGGIYM